MALIKSENAPANLKPSRWRTLRRGPAAAAAARQQAEELLAGAQREAESLKETARAEGTTAGLEQGRAEGMRAGAEAGRQEALEEHRARLSSAVAALAAAAAEIDARRQDLEAAGLREVVQLAAAIARRVTKRQGLVDESVLAANLAGAMKLAVQAADVRIAAHPSQRATLDAALPALRMEWPALRHVEWVDDAALAPGGCRIFTRGGRVDADLDSQLDRVIEELLPAEKRPA